MDVIEIDAASNRGINEMRELRENVRYRPARDRYKVFIVDEAHQITSEAFNALLKTLEEPPEWVVFVLCTTEAHKIPATIASRCQQFSFRSVDFAELVGAHGVDLRAGRHRGRCRRRWRCWRRRAKAACAIRSRRSIRPSPAAGTSWTRPRCARCWACSRWTSLGAVTQALWRAATRGAMLEVVAELEAQRAQPAALRRELARYFRNLLVAKIAGAETRLVAASRAEQREAGGGGRRFQRRGSDALPAALARPVPRSAVLAAAAAAPGDGSAAAGAGGRAASRSKKRWRRWGAARSVPRRSPRHRLPPQAAPARLSRAGRGSTVERAICATRLHAALLEARHAAHRPMRWSTPSVAESGGELRVHDAARCISCFDEASRNSKRRADEWRADGAIKIKVTAGKPRGGSRRRPRAKAGRSGRSARWRIRKCSAFRRLFPEAQVRAVRNLKE